MSVREFPPLPGLNPATALSPDDPGYCDWLESAAISPEGVDRSLIWENLHLSPTERLRKMQGFLDSFRVGDRGGPSGR